MKTDHINIIDNSGRIYCHRLAKITKMNPYHYETHCKMCPYFVDTAGGKGVECQYDDGTNVDFMIFRDAVEAEHHSKSQMVKMGAMDEEEMLNTMDGYHDDQTPTMTPGEEKQADEMDEKTGEAKPPDLSVEETDAS